jgi:hypothetical protein
MAVYRGRSTWTLGLRMRILGLSAGLLLAFWGVAVGAPPKGAVSNERAACALLKRRVAELGNLPPSGPPGLGWFCDFASGWDRDLFVIALRSNRKCPEICSNLMGWYAIRKSTGEVGEFDINEATMTALRPKS